MLTNCSMVLKFNLWHSIISWFASWIVNYGWAIIVFTIALKLVMSPLDIYQRISSKKQQKFQTAMQPELQAVQAKYANDKTKLNQETAKIYKKYNFSVGGMCLTMLLTMGLSMVVFFTLFSSLRSLGDTKLKQSFNKMNTACETYMDGKTFETLTEDEEKELTILIRDAYDDQKKENSWLWVKNVWKGDTNTSQFIDFKTYSKGMSDSEKVEAEKRYDFIVEAIDGDKADANGYYVLIILSVAISFLTQWLSMKLTMPKGQKMNIMNKVMLGVIPLTMLILAFTSNVVFTLYIIANSIMTAIISTVLHFAMKKKNGKDDDIVIKPKNMQVVEYSRNYKK